MVWKWNCSIVSQSWICFAIPTHVKQIAVHSRTTSCHYVRINYQMRFTTHSLQVEVEGEYCSVSYVQREPPFPRITIACAAVSTSRSPLKPPHEQGSPYLSYSFSSFQLHSLSRLSCESFQLFLMARICHLMVRKTWENNKLYQEFLHIDRKWIASPPIIIDADL